MAWLLIAMTVAFQSDTTIVLGLTERDLTGDGSAETLLVIGVGRTIDDLNADFTIESAGTTVYRFKLQPLTRTVGFDAGRRVIPAEEHRVRLNEFGRWFFAQEKFQQPAEFVDSLRASAPGRLAEIPDVIARHRQDSDPRSGGAIWDEILKSPTTIFTFSPGGDAIAAIGWSTVAGRFYPILECC